MLIHVGYLKVKGQVRELYCNNNIMEDDILSSSSQLLTAPIAENEFGLVCDDTNSVPVLRTPMCKGLIRAYHNALIETINAEKCYAVILRDAEVKLSFIQGYCVTDEGVFRTRYFPETGSIDKARVSNSRLLKRMLNTVETFLFEMNDHYLIDPELYQEYIQLHK